MILASSEKTAEWLNHMAEALKLETENTPNDEVVLIGIKTGGVLVAEALSARLENALPTGELNISFYRDDFSRIGLHPTIGPTQLNFDVEGKTVILVDDVLYSGRTVRAALNEIFDYGRPKRVILCVLAERDGGRELPIAATVKGGSFKIPMDAQIKLSAEDLSLSQVQ